MAGLRPLCWWLCGCLRPVCLRLLPGSWRRLFCRHRSGGEPRH
eukprot:gene12615-40557_t